MKNIHFSDAIAKINHSLLFLHPLLILNNILKIYTLEDLPGKIYPFLA